MVASRRKPGPTRGDELRHVRHPRHLPARRRPRAEGAPVPDGGRHRPSRPRRRGELRRRPVRDRHAAAIDHRPGCGHQPLANADGTLWLVANGEIYNFRELRRDLEARGHRFKTGSDCETIIHLYAEHGDDCVRHLNGMFAFALWDARRRRLLIGRDRLGIKPVYLYNDGKRLVFASEAKAIFALPGVPAEVDPAALDSYVSLGYVPAPQSIFRGIEKLPPATLLVAEGGRVSRRRYWRIPDSV